MNKSRLSLGVLQVGNMLCCWPEVLMLMREEKQAVLVWLAASNQAAKHRSLKIQDEHLHTTLPRHPVEAPQNANKHNIVVKQEVLQITHKTGMIHF